MRITAGYRSFVSVMNSPTTEGRSGIAFPSSRPLGMSPLQSGTGDIGCPATGQVAKIKIARAAAPKRPSGRGMHVAETPLGHGRRVFIVSPSGELLAVSSAMARFTISPKQRQGPADPPVHRRSGKVETDDAVSTPGRCASLDGTPPPGIARLAHKLCRCGTCYFRGLIDAISRAAAAAIWWRSAAHFVSKWLFWPYLTGARQRREGRS
jgi:hypothetical protein